MWIVPILYYPTIINHQPAVDVDKYKICCTEHNNRVLGLTYLFNFYCKL